MMKTICFLCFIFFTSIAKTDCQVIPTPKPSSPPLKSKTANQTTYNINESTGLSYRIINSANRTFCYDIFNKNRLVIHQPSVPGLAGKTGFRTKADAIKVARLVIKKLKQGQLPPTVTLAEMKRLKVIN